MKQIETVTTKAKNPSTGNFEDVTWGGINVLSTSGTTNYNNLTNKPTINGVTVQGSLTTGDLLITAVDVGALPSGTKYGADFALSIDSQTFVVTAQLKDQDGNNLGQAKTIDLPLETMVVSGSYDDTTQKIILTLKNGQTVEFSIADLVSGLQSEITLSNKLDADLVSDVSSENKFVTTAEKTAWNAKANASEVYTKSQTDSAIETAIGALDVSSVGGSGKYISAISETNGKISATPTAFDTALSSSSTDGNAPTTKAVYDDQQRQDAEIGDIANRGAKNLLKIDAIGATSNHGRTYVKNGITFSLNADGTVSATGTATENAFAYLFFNDEMVHIDDFCNGQHILSGCPANGSSSTYRIYVGKTGYRYDDTGNGRLLPDHGEVAEISLAVYVSSGYTIETPLIFKPMICTAADWAVSQKFVPYAPTNRELYEMIQELQNNS